MTKQNGTPDAMDKGEWSLEDGDTENKIAILASAKLDALEALLGDLNANGHRALVFSQFVVRRI